MEKECSYKGQLSHTPTGTPAASTHTHTPSCTHTRTSVVFAQIHTKANTLDGYHYIDATWHLVSSGMWWEGGAGVSCWLSGTPQLISALVGLNTSCTLHEPGGDPMVENWCQLWCNCEGMGKKSLLGVETHTVSICCPNRAICWNAPLSPV